MPAVDINESISSNTGGYTAEIQKMMYGFGDSCHPLKETAELVENVVREQLILLLKLLFDVASKTDSKKIGIKEFLILLRHSPVKLRRFCTYLQVTDFKKYLDTDEGEKEMADLTMLHSDSKKLKAALTFLQHIDPSGYLCSVADPTNPSSLTDDSLKERNQRIEKMTCAMDVQQYLEYAKAKSSSFKRSQPNGKFQDWLLKGRAPEIPMNAKAWSILSYFAYETVAQIVDLAFIVRRDNTAGQVADAVERNTVPRVSPANADLSKPTWSNSTKPLQVDEVTEALRRFNNCHNSMFVPFRRNGAPPSRCRLLGL